MSGSSRTKLDLSFDDEVDEEGDAGNQMFAAASAGNRPPIHEQAARRVPSPASARVAKKIAQPAPSGKDGLNTGRTKSDRKVLSHLKDLKRESRHHPPQGGDCVASIPEIGKACDISNRQVQISIDRLAADGLLERVTYDFGNSDRTKRGTIFKIHQ